MFAVATQSFYTTKDKVVFSANPSENITRKKEEFTTANFINPQKKLVHFFSDEKQISLYLNEKSLELLQNRFAEDNFLSLKNNNLALSGRAAAFVDSWYKDIMYKRNFINADYDKNGRIEGEEFLSLKNAVSDRAENQDLSVEFETIILRAAKSTQGYVSSQLQKEGLSIGDLLSQSIENDRDFNGAITRLEYAAKGGSDDEGYENWAKKSLEKILGELFNLTLVLDPHHTITPLWEGKSIDEIKAQYGIYNSKAQEQEDDQEEESKIKEKKKSLDKEALLREFPEFRFLIENINHISKQNLQKLRDQQAFKQEITRSYQAHIRQDFDEFSSSLLELDLRV